MSVQPPPPQGPPGPATPPGITIRGPPPGHAAPPGISPRPPPGISPGPAPPGVSASAKRKAEDAGPAPPPQRSKPGKEHRKTWESGTFRDGPLWNLGDVVNVEFDIAGSNGASDHWYATVTKIWHAGTTTAGKQGLTVRYHCDGTTDFVDFKDVAYCLARPERDVPKPNFTVDMSAFQVEQGLHTGAALSPKVPGDGIKRSMAWTEADNNRLIALIIPYWPSPSPNWIQLAHDYNAGSAIGDRTLESIKARFKRLRDKGRLGPYRPYVPGSGGAGMGLLGGIPGNGAPGAPGTPGAPVPAPPGKGGSALDMMAAAAASAVDADGAAAILAMAASNPRKNKKPPLPPGPPPASAFLQDVAIAPRKKTERSKARTKTTIKREKKKMDPFEQSSVQQNREERIDAADKPFQCHQCTKSFTAAFALKRHERIHTGEKAFRCRECSKSFSRKDALKQHDRVHNRPDGLSDDAEGTESDASNSSTEGTEEEEEEEVKEEPKKRRKTAAKKKK